MKLTRTDPAKFADMRHSPSTVPNDRFAACSREQRTAGVGREPALARRRRVTEIRP